MALKIKTLGQKGKALDKKWTNKSIVAMRKCGLKIFFQNFPYLGDSENKISIQINRHFQYIRCLFQQVLIMYDNEIVTTIF